ncbi:MAG: sugar transferase [Solirubrobacteraceae bacterium]|nr:sugar transferase [Solirubrobacteraceae bacterium]
MNDHGEPFPAPVPHALPSQEAVAERPIVERSHAQTSGQRDRTYRRSLAVSDAVAMVTALVFSIAIVGGQTPRATALLALPLLTVMIKSIGLYDRDELLLRKTTLDEAPQLFHVATVIALVSSFLDNQIVFGDLANTTIFALWVSSFLSLLLFRYTARSIVTARVAVERCLVLGAEATAEDVEVKLGSTHAVSAHVVDRISFVPGQVEALIPRLERAISEGGIERVIVAPEQVDQSEILDVVRAIKAVGVNVTLVPRIFEVLGSSVVFDDLSGMQLLAMRRLRMSRSSLLLKRCLDLAVSGTGLLCISPVLFAFALAIKLDTRGSVFFRQTRVGRDGERFQILKFRTMVADAESQKDELRGDNETEGLFKIAGDPRVTRVGRLLRKTSLDELPQLINVFKGDMSLVGPRPLVVDEDSQVVGWHRRRLALTPGMTGQWQILGSAKIPLHEMVKIDYLYVTTWSFWTDLKILIRTIPYVLRGGGL